MNIIKLKFFQIMSVSRKGTPLSNTGVIFILYLSVLFLQNWFVYDKLPTNLAGEKHIIEFQNNVLPLAENYNSYCQVRFFLSFIIINCKNLIYVIQIGSIHQSLLLLIMNFVCRLNLTIFFEEIHFE